MTLFTLFKSAQKDVMQSFESYKKTDGATVGLVRALSAAGANKVKMNDLKAKKGLFEVAAAAFREENTSVVHVDFAQLLGSLRKIQAQNCLPKVEGLFAFAKKDPLLIKALSISIPCDLEPADLQTLSSLVQDFFTNPPAGLTSFKLELSKDATYELSDAAISAIFKAQAANPKLTLDIDVCLSEAQESKHKTSENSRLNAVTPNFKANRRDSLSSTVSSNNSFNSSSSSLTY